MDKDSQEFDCFDRPGFRKARLRLLLAFCALSLLTELYFVFGQPRKGHFTIDEWFGFYAALAFAGSAILVLLARVLGFALRRPESYYGDAGEETLPEDVDESA